MSYVIRYNFSTCDGSSKFSLCYRLFDNDFTYRWLQAVQYDLMRPNPMRQGLFYGSRFINESQVRSEIQANIDIVNRHSPKSGPWIKENTYPDMSHNHLMKLHEEFETLHSHFTFQSPNSPREIVQALGAINVAIHRYESLYSRKDKFHVDIRFKTASSWCFEEEDYKLFSVDQDNGILYLDYGVTGVPVINAYLQDVKQRPIPQYNFKSGAKIYFRNKIRMSHFKDDLETWLAQKWQMDINDPKLAIGYIPLGQLTENLDVDQIGSQLETHTVIEPIEILDGTSLSPVPIPFLDHQIKPAPVPFLDHQIKKYVDHGNKEDQTFEKVCQEPWNVDEQLLKVGHKNLIPIASSTLLPAKWPTDPDIHSHLDLQPWITLPWEFPPTEPLQEANQLLDQFVLHRNYDTDENLEGRWKSLAIKGHNGLSTNTYAHTHYHEKPNYQLTDIAERCPKTLELLNQITDIDQCARIRFMLLEPKAKIHVHRDSEDKDVSLAINISLNMPVGCDFWIDTDSNGQHRRFTRPIPVRDGQIFLLNNAKYHYVENNSDTPRIHIIAHGPIRISDKQLLASARKQSQIQNHRDLINQLVVKKSLQGKHLDKPDNPLYIKWNMAGIHSDLFPSDIKLFLLIDEIKDIKDLEILHESTYYITGASLFPVSHHILLYSKMDKELPLLYDKGVQFVICVGGGTYSEGIKLFIHYSLLTIHEMERQGASAAGHIIDRPDRSSGLPFFHEQFFILDLKLWDSLGRPEISQPYSNKPTSFPKYNKGECVHDDYTPKFIESNAKSKINTEDEKEFGGLGTLFMAETLRNKLKVINIPAHLRGIKSFSYPRNGKCWQREKVKKRIQEKLKCHETEIYFFNTEELYASLFRVLPGLRPKSFYSVASGFKSYVLLQEIEARTGTIPHHSFFDYNQMALSHQKMMKQMKEKEELVFYLTHQVGHQNSIENNKAQKLVSEKIHKVLDDYFQGDYNNLFKIIDQSETTYTHLNLLTNPHNLIEQIDFNQPFMVWCSNIWDNQDALFHLNRDELNDNFIHFVHLIKKKTNQATWVSTRRYQQHAIWGDSLDEPYGIVTCGYGTLNKSDFMQV